MTQRTPRHALLQAHVPLLTQALRGIEREGLRVDQAGRLSNTSHPISLGSALTNPHITTDYSEALLELITGTHDTVDALLGELKAIHQFVESRLGDELIWTQSMPSHLPPEPDIPIGWYGTSNSGMLKHVYRRGLAERYGKAMQCIAGVHYNFSLPDAFWHVLDTPGHSPEDQRSKGYMALIRNFNRYAWLLMYLFGASPAVSLNFLQGKPHHLEVLHDDTLYLPYATSLRMTDLGYTNKVQSDLELCYNDVETFVRRMYDAVTTPWPPYEAIGTHRNGEWIQLNTNVLQIENEYYSSIRPKRTVERGERPATALQARGVQYVEVRCLDIDPFSPLGISAESSRFIDTFLIFCATEDSPFFPDNGFCRESLDNFALVAKQGRKPNLLLSRQDEPTPLASWGQELLEAMQPYAELLDTAFGGQEYTAALRSQQLKVADIEATPSATLLRLLRDNKISLHEYTLQLSRQHREELFATELPVTLEEAFRQAAKDSLQAQAELEKSDTESFSSYVARYHAGLKRPVTA